MAPLIVVVALVPLVVRMAAVPLTGPAFDFWTGQTTNYDFFSYYKSRLFLVAAGAALVSAVIVVARGRWGRERIPLVASFSLCGYACFALASTRWSPFPAIAWSGFVDRDEGLPVWLGYLVVAAAAYILAGRGRRATAVVWAFAWSALVIGLIGVCQAFGFDLFQSEVGRQLILPAEYRWRAAELAFTLPSRVVYATLYHYNYVGTYMAMAAPFFLALAFCGASGRLRMLAGVAGSLAVFDLIACGSRGGLVGGLIGLVVLAVVERRRIEAHGRMITVAACAVLAIAFLTDAAAGGRLRHRLGAAVTDYVTLVLGRIPPPAPPIQHVRIDGRRLTFSTPGGTLEMLEAGGQLQFHDQSGQELVVALDAREGRITIPDDRFRMLEFTFGRINGRPSLVVRDGNFRLNFLLTGLGFVAALDSGRAVSAGPVDAWLFKGRETLGSSRAYIWARTLPLLPGAVWLGYGPDTFAAVFPQHDFEGKFQTYGTTNVVVDKPHSMWLQMAVNTGIASVVLLVVLFAWYCGASARRFFWHRPTDLTQAIGVACFAGVAGYLAAGFFNDSVVSVAPVFWVLLGLGVRANGDADADPGLRPQ